MNIHDLAGKTLGQYELRELLGVGGMGTVYRAYQPGLGREVAVKVLPASIAAESGYAARFTREAHTVAALEHPHIVPIYDYGTQDGISYVVMRLLVGGTLKQRLDTGNLPDLAEIVILLKQLAEALDYAHSHTVIHRDIKPANVMFDNRGSAFLVDFGIAKMAKATHILTADGQIMGTPAYMAPEQWVGEMITPAADQYALAALTYHILTGRPPFDGETPHVMMHKHLKVDAPPVTLLRPDLSPALNPVLARALSKDLNARYPAVGAFAADFEQALTNPLPVNDLQIIFDSLPQTIPQIPAPPESAAQTPVLSPLPVAPATRKHAAAQPTQFARRTEPMRQPPTGTSRIILFILPLLLGLGGLIFFLFNNNRPVSIAGLPTLMVLPEQTEPASPTTEATFTPPVTTTTLAVTAMTTLANTSTRLPPTASVTPQRVMTQLIVPLPTAVPTQTATRRPSPTPRPTITPSPTLSAVDYYILGQQALAAADYVTAISYFDIALLLEPIFADAFYGRGFTYWMLGDPDQAYNDFTQVIGLSPSYLPAFDNRGQISLDRSDYPAAIDDFTHVLILNPSYASAYQRRGLAYLWQGDYPAAIADQTSALSLDPSNVDSYYYRGLAYGSSGDLVAAVNDYTAALSLRADYVEVYASRGDAYAGLDDIESALADFSAAVSLNPDYSYGYQRLGDLYYDLGDRDNALANYLRYLELAGEAAEPYVLERIAEMGG